MSNSIQVGLQNEVFLTSIFFQAGMLVYLNTINSNTEYFGPSHYSNSINTRHSYIIAALSLSLAFVEILTFLKKVVIASPSMEAEMTAVSARTSEGDVSSLPSKGDVV